jgi:3-methyladenine DNA glycosylase AlkC
MRGGASGAPLHGLTRHGARSMAEVPRAVLIQLEDGEIETVNLMEWLAIDMGALARNVALRLSVGRLRFALERAAEAMVDKGVTARLRIAGQAIAEAVADFDSPTFRHLALHASDVVRQWACYAVNSAATGPSLSERLSLTLPFDADDNMSVREAAWMAFRPRVIMGLEEAIASLERISRSPNARERRFAIETLRPRSVWGAHIEKLKRRPEMALSVLENVRHYRDAYVQRAVGNWLNDASKSQPDWVRDICSLWSAQRNRHTDAIVRRGLRTLARGTNGMS